MKKSEIKKLIKEAYKSGFLEGKIGAKMNMTFNLDGMANSYADEQVKNNFSYLFLINLDADHEDPNRVCFIENQTELEAFKQSTVAGDVIYRCEEIYRHTK